MHDSCVIIILSSTGFFKPAFSRYYFVNLVFFFMCFGFSCFCILGFCLFCPMFRIRCHLKRFNPFTASFILFSLYANDLSYTVLFIIHYSLYTVIFIIFYHIFGSKVLFMYKNCLAFFIIIMQSIK